MSIYLLKQTANKNLFETHSYISLNNPIKATTFSSVNYRQKESLILWYWELIKIHLGDVIYGHSASATGIF